MLRKNVFTIAACATLSLLVIADDLDENRPRSVTLSCWRYRVVPESFEVGYYFSSRSKKNVRSTADSQIGSDIDFDPDRKTAMLVHGYLGNSVDGGMDLLRDALLEWQDINVIAVDWRNGSSIINYVQAAANTVRAASGLKGLIDKLVRLTKKPFDQWNTVHFIGFSLGAHVVGQAAAALKKENLIVDRITGLDPAEPCFDDPNSHLRLKKTDARFIDIIHTDAAERKTEKFGLRDALGHADFYINGGSQQPGCPPTIYTNETKRKMEAINSAPPKRIEEVLQYVLEITTHVFDTGYCHHLRSVEVFLQTIVQATRASACKFWAHPWSLNTSEAETSRIIKERCDELNCVEAGINAEKYRNRPDSSYYVKTSGQVPYCLKQK